MKLAKSEKVDALETKVAQSTKETKYVVQANSNFIGNIYLSVIGKIVIVSIQTTAKSLVIGNNIMTSDLPLNLNYAFTDVKAMAGGSFYGQGRIMCNGKSVTLSIDATNAPVEIYCTFVTTLSE